MEQIDGEIYHVLGLEESILWKWVHYRKWSTYSIQSLSKLPKGIFHRTRTNNFTICTETQNMPDSQSNLEKEKWRRKNQIPWLQMILQSYSNQNNMVLAQKQNYRPMVQNRKCKDKPTSLCYLVCDKRGRNSAEKTASSISGAGKSGQQYVKEWN